MDESRFSQLHVCEDDEAIDQSERDRLSELPDSLILSILSFLSMVDVVRTTILSKRWKHLWATIPCLHFIIRDHNLRCVDFISGALAQWKGAKIQKFSLSFYIHHPVHSDIHSWLLFAIEKQVEEVFMDLYNWDRDYFSPHHLYSCSSITKLSLTIRKLEIENTVQWNKLKSLTIIVEGYLSGDAMNQVLSGAPHLEELVLSFWRIGGILNIRSTSLKTLNIDHNACNFNETAMLRIWAPNLVTLDLSALNCGGCSLVVPSLITAILSLQNIYWEFKAIKNFNQVFRSLGHVEKLTLSEWIIKFLPEMKKRNMDVPLSNAKFLKLYVHEAKEILDVLDIFPKLMHIIVDHKVDFDKPRGPCSFGSPSVVELKRVEITWSAGDASIFRVMKYLLENAHKLEKMVLRLRMAGANPETFVLAEEKVRSMPRSSPTAQLIITKI